MKLYLFWMFSHFSLDNPLICSCELVWFPNLLKDLKNRDDEMTQKKRPMCTMLSEHREYFVQNMPLERMSCSVGPKGRMSSGGNKFTSVLEMILGTVFGTMSVCSITLRRF